MKLLVLQIPLATVTRILKEEYVLGEAFTMSGEKVTGPAGLTGRGLPSDGAPVGKDKPGSDKVISLFERKTG